MMCKQKTKSKGRRRQREREKGARERDKNSRYKCTTQMRCLPLSIESPLSFPLYRSPTLFCSAQVTAAVAVALLLLLAWYAALSGMLCVRLSVPPAKCVCASECASGCGYYYNSVNETSTKPASRERVQRASAAAAAAGRV